MSCESGYGLYEKEENFFRNCAWNEKKDWMREGAEAISYIRGKIATVTDGICEPCTDEALSQFKK